MPYFEAADGTKLYYATWGTGRPIVMIHGGNMGAEVWQWQIPYLVDRGYCCILYDQRGIHRSDAPADGYDFDTFADDLRQLVVHLKLDEFMAVAFSAGSGVLARYLARYGGDAVIKAVLVAPTTPFVCKTPDNPEGLDREAQFVPFYAAMKKDRPKLFTDSADMFFCPDTAETPVSKEVMAWAVSACMQSPLMAVLKYYQAGNETDFRNDMRAFSMPTLILHGDRDPFAIPAITGARTHRAIPHSRLKWYEGASHGIFFTHQDRLNEDIAAFFSRFVEAGAESEEEGVAAYA